MGAGWLHVRIEHDGLHRYLWRRTNEHGHVVFSNQGLATTFEVGLDTVEENVRAMRAAGRLRLVRYNHEHRRVYQIADPAQWRADDPSTHAQASPRVPSWG